MSIGSPRISVISVVLNARTDLERTIASVVAQKYSPVEFIVMDGGSSDGTVDVIRKYENHISLWRSEPDRGLYDAMNKAMEASGGEYLWFVNAGDEIRDPRTLEAVFQGDEPLADVYYGDTEIIDSDGTSVGLRSDVTVHALPETLGWRDMRMGMAVCHQSFIVRKSVAVPYDLSHPYCADIDWMIRCLKRSGRTVNVHGVLSRFAVGGLSKQRHFASLKDRFFVLQKHFGFGPNIVNHFKILGRAAARRFQRAGTDPKSRSGDLSG